MKNLPISMQTFSDLMTQNYLYVDKTKEIYNLFARGGKYYFLSRPRRFGKSLLVSILNEIFSGNKELFKGLWIYDKMEWKKHPIIHIDFTGIDFETVTLLKNSLNETLERTGNEFSIQLTSTSYKTRFAELIRKLAISQNSNVVVLIDEYDKPIIDFIETEEIEIAQGNRKVLKKFYSVLKGSDKYIRFVFVTGVSKFSRMSIFSDLNNLNDITIDDNFSTLLGLTHEELLKYFDDRIDSLSQKMKMSKNDLLENIKQWYNGYSWDGRHFLYNPHSILNFFSKNRFGNYWFASATPTFLINHMKNREKDIRALEREEVDEAIFESYDIENLEVISMLFQTGYLTIKDIIPVGIKSKYVLSYPNEEVKESFLKHFLSNYTTEETGIVGSKILDLVEAAGKDDLENFFTIIKSLFAAIPSHLFLKDREAYYHTIIYLVLKLLGVNIDVEVHTNKGRIDAVMKTETNIYVMEFKMGTSDEALSQIERMKYHEKYLSSGKSIQLIGIRFDEEEKNISYYKAKPVKG
ncbi:MAG: ATP-binding protein [Candidatus Aminicenantes bacterium]|nr:MAG: ATP-binding protein [Candidatus Aminicenantes bacterium]